MVLILISVGIGSEKSLSLKSDFFSLFEKNRGRDRVFVQR